MDALQNLRPRISGVVLSLGLFYIFTNADLRIQRWWWIPASGLALWALTLLFYRPQDGAPRAASGWVNAFRLAVDRSMQLAERLVDAILALIIVMGLGSLVPNLPRLDLKLVLTSFLGLLTVVFVGLLFLYIREGQAVELRSHWGGLGGSVAGWRLSMPLVCLVAALAFGALATIVNLRPLPGAADASATPAVQKPVVPAPAEQKGAAPSPGGADPKSQAATNPSGKAQ